MSCCNIFTGSTPIDFTSQDIDRYTNYAFIEYPLANATILDIHTGEILWHFYGLFGTNIIKAQNDKLVRYIPEVLASNIIYPYQSRYTSCAKDRDNFIIEDGYLKLVYPSQVFNIQPIKSDNPWNYDFYNESTDKIWGAFTQDYIMRNNGDWVDYIDINGAVTNSRIDLPYPNMFNPEYDIFSPIFNECDINAFKSSPYGITSLTVFDNNLLTFLNWNIWFQKITPEGYQFYVVGECSGKNLDYTSQFFVSSYDVIYKGQTVTLNLGLDNLSSLGYSSITPLIYDGDSIIAYAHLYYGGRYYGDIDIDDEAIWEVQHKLIKINFDDSFTSHEEWLEFYFNQFDQSANIEGDDRYPLNSFQKGALEWMTDSNWDLTYTSWVGKSDSEFNYNHRVVNITKNSDTLIYILSTNNLEENFPGGPYFKELVIVGFNLSDGTEKYETHYSLTENLIENPPLDTYLYETVNSILASTDQYLFIEIGISKFYNNTTGRFANKILVFDNNGDLHKTFSRYIENNAFIIPDIDTIENLNDNEFDPYLYSDIYYYDSYGNLGFYFKEDYIIYNAWHKIDDEWKFALTALDKDYNVLWYNDSLFVTGGVANGPFNKNGEGLYLATDKNCYKNENHLVVTHPRSLIRPSSNHDRLRQDLELYSYQDYNLWPNWDKIESDDAFLFDFN